MLIRAFFVWLVLVPSLSVAGEKCIPVRPQALTTAAVDSLILETIVRNLRLASGEIDTSKTIEQLDKTQNGALSLIFILGEIDDSLAIKTMEALARNAKAKTIRALYETIPVSRIQTVSRENYFAGTDKSYEIVKEGTEYSASSFSVRVPGQLGWMLVTCRLDYIAFQNSSKQNEVVSVGAREVSLPAYVGDEQFIEQGKQSLRSAAPIGYQVETVTAEAFKQSGSPCILLHEVAMPRNLPPGPLEHAPLLIEVRVCYEAQTGTRGQSAMYSYIGNMAVDEIRRQARLFIADVKPRQ